MRFLWTDHQAGGYEGRSQKGRAHQPDERTKRQVSSTEFPGNGQLFEALLSQVDKTI